MSRGHGPLRFYEVWAEGREDAVEGCREDADREAQRIAEDEWVTVEVRPMQIGPRGLEIGK